MSRRQNPPRGTLITVRAAGKMSLDKEVGIEIFHGQNGHMTRVEAVRFLQQTTRFSVTLSFQWLNFHRAYEEFGGAISSAILSKGRQEPVGGAWWRKSGVCQAGWEELNLQEAPGGSGGWGLLAPHRSETSGIFQDSFKICFIECPVCGHKLRCYTSSGHRGASCVSSDCRVDTSR